MRFRRIRGIKISYERQGLIFFTMANYRALPKQAREKIDQLIRDVAKNDEIYITALRDWLLNGTSWNSVCIRTGVNEGTLIRYRRKIYERW